MQKNNNAGRKGRKASKKSNKCRTTSEKELVRLLPPFPSTARGKKMNEEQMRKLAEALRRGFDKETEEE